MNVQFGAVQINPNARWGANLGRAYGTFTLTGHNDKQTYKSLTSPHQPDTVELSTRSTEVYSRRSRLSTVEELGKALQLLASSDAPKTLRESIAKTAAEKLAYLAEESPN